MFLLKSKSKNAQLSRLMNLRKVKLEKAERAGMSRDAKKMQFALSDESKLPRFLPT